MFMLSLLQLFFGGDLRWAAGVLRHAGKDAMKEQRHEAPSLGRSGRWTNWVPSECHRRRKCWWWLWLTLYHDLRYLWNSADYVLSRVKWIWIISVEWWSSWSSTDVSWSNLNHTHFDHPSSDRFAQLPERLHTVSSELPEGWPWSSGTTAGCKCNSLCPLRRRSAEDLESRSKMIQGQVVRNLWALDGLGWQPYQYGKPTNMAFKRAGKVMA
jgi:hypothetical protein